MLSEIGSNFWLDPQKDYSETCKISLSNYHLYGSDIVFLSTGRAAENLVLDEIEKRNDKINKVAIVPPYTCHTVIDPFFLHGYEIYTYPITDSLNTTAESLEEVIRQKHPSVVLLHRLFGFDTLQGCNEIVQRYSELGVVFIEDGTHDLFSNHKRLDAEYHVGSLRKWAGLPDGGYAICRTGSFQYKPAVYDKVLMSAKLDACYAKYQYIFNGIGCKEEFLKMYSVAEQILENESGYYKISPISESIFMEINKEECEKQRRNNYSVMYEGLKKTDGVELIMGELDENTVPLYCPIYVKERAFLQRKLRDAHIYSPIIWPLPEKRAIINEAAIKLYRNLLCIPIDQRYESEDMQRIIECINEGV